MEKAAGKMAKIAIEEHNIMNAPYFDNTPVRRSEFRERRYPLLALLDTLLGWTIGLAALAVGLYVIGRIALFFYPAILNWLHFS
jgi:hypothetical protein